MNARVFSFCFLLSGLGSFEPTRIDMGMLQPRLSQPGVPEDLRRVQIRSPGEIRAHFVPGTREIPSLILRAPLNTDDNALLEFSAPKTLYSDTSEQNFRDLAQHSGNVTAYLKPVPESRAPPAAPAGLRSSGVSGLSAQEPAGGDPEA